MSAAVYARRERARSRRRPVPEGIRITKVGFWYVLIALVVAVAATNTGNNALYMVLAVMLAVLVISGVASRNNVRHLELELDVPGEIFANRPFLLRFQLRNRGRWLPRWFVVFSVARRGEPRLIPYLPAGGGSGGRLEIILERRGVHRLRFGHVSSLFPFGFFRKGTRYPVDLELLIYPELFTGAGPAPEELGHGEDASGRRAGWGHDLYALRLFRQGDDPRGIHWKQTARTGRIIFREREEERGRRVSILFDNGVGELATEAERQRFERLVSEAATAALDYMAQGFEVELVTRDGELPFARGARQRAAILEALALIEPRPRGGAPLSASDPEAPRLRLALERKGVAA